MPQISAGCQGVWVEVSGDTRSRLARELVRFPPVAYEDSVHCQVATHQLQHDIIRRLSPIAAWYYTSVCSNMTHETWATRRRFRRDLHVGVDATVLRKGAANAVTFGKCMQVYIFYSLPRNI